MDPAACGFFHPSLPPSLSSCLPACLSSFFLSLFLLVFNKPLFSVTVPYDTDLVLAPALKGLTVK